MGKSRGVKPGMRTWMSVRGLKPPQSRYERVRVLKKEGDLYRCADRCWCDPEKFPGEPRAQIPSAHCLWCEGPLVRVSWWAWAGLVFFTRTEYESLAPQRERYKATSLDPYCVGKLVPEVLPLSQWDQLTAPTRPGSVYSSPSPVF